MADPMVKLACRDQREVGSGCFLTVYPHGRFEKYETPGPSQVSGVSFFYGQPASLTSSRLCCPRRRHRDRRPWATHLPRRPLCSPARVAVALGSAL